MRQPEEGRLPDELEAVAARLQADRAQADPLQLDQIKQRVIMRCSGQARRSTFIKSKLATMASLLALLGGTGGAIAVASNAGGNGNGNGAANGQYRPGKGCGDENHIHNTTGCPPQSQNHARDVTKAKVTHTSHRTRHHARKH